MSIALVEFIFFLTYNDVTVRNAIDVFEETKNTGIKYVGFKDIGLPKNKLIELHSKMKKEGMTTFLEVVTATEEDNVRSTKIGVELGVDYIIGGIYARQTLPLLQDTNIKYFPYIGKVVGHPCLLRGAIKEIAADARMVEELGVSGIDLLAYRYDGNPERLIRSIQNTVEIPLIVAGSINSLERVRKMVDLDVWAFTIGSAIFDRKFVSNGTLGDQIKTVLERMG